MGAGPIKLATMSTGVALWAAIILLPLVSALAAPFDSGDAVSVSWVTFGSSALLACAIAAVAVVLGYVPGVLLGRARRGRILLLLLLLTPLLLPRYVLYYAWTLLLSPNTTLGRALAGSGDMARMVGSACSTMVMMLWYWPLAALLISHGRRQMDEDVCDMARVDSSPLRRFWHVTLPLTWRPITLAFAVCAMLAMSEFSTFHLAGVRTVGTELAAIYEMTGSASAVLRASRPILALAAAVAIALSLALGRAAPTSVGTGPGGHSGRWRQMILVGLIALSVAAPVGLLIAHVGPLPGLGGLVSLHADELATSAALSAAAAVLAVVIATGVLLIGRMGRPGRAAPAVMHVPIITSLLLPGSIVAAAILRTHTLLRASVGLDLGAWLVSAGQAARFAGIVLIVLRLLDDQAGRALSEQASVDGASGLQAWWRVHLPRLWPVPVGAALLVMLLGMTELPAAMVLLPAGVPSFAQMLMNQMHYARQQDVILACLMLIGTYMAVGAVAAGTLALARRRASLSVLVVVGLCVAVAGCDRTSSAPGEPEVVNIIGATGVGPGEFVYPRAIDLGANDTLVVVDKTGRIQTFSRDGTPLSVFRTPAIEAGKPTGLTVGPSGNIYVADTHYHRILIYSPDGQLLGQFGSYGQGDGQFIYPTDVAIAPDGRIFVSEYGGNDRISVWSEEGEFLFSFGEQGAGPGQLDRPSAICIDAARGRLYVADACNHRIVVYDLAGVLLDTFGSVGTAPGRLRYPYDVTLMDDGTVVVCEFGNNRIQLFDPEGQTLRICGGPGRQPGQLAYPWGVVIDSQRRVYVIDSGNNRLQVWKL